MLYVAGTLLLADDGSGGLKAVWYRLGEDIFLAVVDFQLHLGGGCG